MPITNLPSLRLVLVPILLLVVALGLSAFGAQPIVHSAASASAPSGAATAISVGVQESCVLTAVGGVECWGVNDFGQLGNGTFTGPETCAADFIEPCSAEPVDVTGLDSSVLAISVGPEYACALTTGGGVKCWGQTPFGHDTCLSGPLHQHVPCSNVPVDVPGLTSDVKAISNGCAVTTGGDVKCWDVGGSLEDVPGLSSDVSAVAGTCALTTGGGVKCWGNNNYGQLGIGNRYRSRNFFLLSAVLAIRVQQNRPRCVGVNLRRLRHSGRRRLHLRSDDWWRRQVLGP